MQRIQRRTLAPVGCLAARQGAAMAHRRRVMRRGKGLAALGLAAMAVCLAAAVALSNNVTSLRRDIAALDALRLCAEAESADLLTRWNAASSVAELTRRGQEELGLVVGGDPGLTLIGVRPPRGQQPGRIRRFLGGLGGADAAQAGESTERMPGGTMISLEPRPDEQKEAR